MLLSDAMYAWRLPEAEKQALQEMVRRVAESGQPIHEPEFLLHPDAREQMWLNLTLSPLLDHNEERAGVVLVFDDVTQEVRLEAELDKMRRLADIGQLAAKMAHEVRNALSPIKGATQMLQSDLEAQSASTEWTSMIVTEVDNLSNLTSEMLNYARQAPLNLQPLDLIDFLTGAVQSLANFLLEHRVIVDWQLAPDLPEILADIAQLGQVMRNLMMNAAQAMPYGGEVRIQADYDRQSQRVLLGIRDTGVGIPASERERIFHPFVTTKPIGTGLGLPIVQRIIDQHGGSISVDSKEGEWTCFTVTLPLHPPNETLPFYVAAIGPNQPGPLPDH
jgi:signal transduction histidine kinase